MKNAKTIVMTSLCSFLVMNCVSMSTISPLSFRNRVLRACKTHDAERLKVPLESLLGKLCYSRCLKERRECDTDKLETLVLDLTNPVAYAKFRDSQMLCKGE